MNLVRSALVIIVVAVMGLSNASAHDGGGGKGIGSSGGAGSGGNGPFDYSGLQFHANLQLEELGNLGASNVIGNDVWGLSLIHI